jgi:alkaline phosphatase
MSEAASIDKMMHVLDYDRALGELLELDDTVRATLAHLKEIGEDEDTLVIVTADHGHGFDVFGNADSQYLAQADGDRAKRRKRGSQILVGHLADSHGMAGAIGVYEQSGLSEYTVAKGSNPQNHTVVFGPQGEGFPVQWDPRYVIAAGFGANPDQ